METLGFDCTYATLLNVSLLKFYVDISTGRHNDKLIGNGNFCIKFLSKINSMSVRKIPNGLKVVKIQNTNIVRLTLSKIAIKTA